MISGLLQKAFHHFSQAVQTAEEEAEACSRGQEVTAGIVDAYMTLVDFCDQQLRKQEEGESGESERKPTSGPTALQITLEHRAMSSPWAPLQMDQTLSPSLQIKIFMQIDVDDFGFFDNKLMKSR